MWDAARAPVRLRVEALDQQHLLRREFALVVPSMRWRVAHREGLALAVRVDERDRDELVFADGVRVCDGKAGDMLIRFEGWMGNG